MQKLKQIINWEYETNQNRAIQKINTPPLPMRMLPY